MADNMNDNIQQKNLTEDDIQKPMKVGHDDIQQPMKDGHDDIQQPMKVGHDINQEKMTDGVNGDVQRKKLRDDDIQLPMKEKMSDDVNDDIQRKNLTDDNIQLPMVIDQDLNQDKMPADVVDKNQEKEVKDDNSQQPTVLDQDLTQSSLRERLKNNSKQPMTTDQHSNQENTPNDVAENTQPKVIRNDELQEPMIVEEQSTIEENKVSDTVDKDKDENNKLKDVAENIQSKVIKNDDLQDPMIVEEQSSIQENTVSDTADKHKDDNIKLKDVAENIQPKVIKNDDLQDPMIVEEQSSIQENKVSDTADKDKDDNNKLKETKDNVKVLELKHQDIQETMPSGSSDKDLNDKMKQINDLQSSILVHQEDKVEEKNKDADENVLQKDNDDSKPTAHPGKQATQILEIICVDDATGSKDMRAKDVSQQTEKCQDTNQVNSDGTHKTDEKSSMLGVQHMIQIYPDGTYYDGQSTSKHGYQDMNQNEDNDMGAQDPLANIKRDEVSQVVNGCDESKLIPVNGVSKYPLANSFGSSRSSTPVTDIEDTRESDSSEEAYYFPSPTGTIYLDCGDSSENEYHKGTLNGSRNEPADIIVLDDSDDDEEPNQPPTPPSVTEPKIPEPQTCQKDLVKEWGSMLIGVHGLERIPYVMSLKNRETWLDSLKKDISKAIQQQLETSIYPLMPNPISHDDLIPEMIEGEKEYRRKKWLMWENFYKDLVEDGTLGQPLHNLLKRSNPSVDDDSPSEKKIKLDDPLLLSPEHDENLKQDDAEISKMIKSTVRGKPEEIPQQQLLFKTKIDEEVFEIEIDFSEITTKNA